MLAAIPAVAEKAANQQAKPPSRHPEIQLCLSAQAPSKGRQTLALASDIHSAPSILARSPDSNSRLEPPRPRVHPNAEQNETTCSPFLSAAIPSSLEHLCGCFVVRNLRNLVPHSLWSAPASQFLRNQSTAIFVTRGPRRSKQTSTTATNFSLHHRLLAPITTRLSTPASPGQKPSLREPSRRFRGPCQSGLEQGVSVLRHA